MNRFKSFIIIMIFCIFSSIPNTTLASDIEMIKTYPLQTIDSLKKGWIFEFNDDIDPITVNTNNIYIEDRDGRQISISVATGSSSGRANTLIIYPNETYKNFCQYTLHIDRNLSSTDQNFLERSIELNFKVELSDKQVPYWSKQLIYNTLSDGHKNLDLSSLNIDYIQTRKLIDEVLDDSPELLYYSHDKIYFDSESKLVKEIRFYYDKSKSTKNKHEDELYDFVENITQTINQTIQEPTQKLRAYYGYVIERINYSSQRYDSRNAYGALINQRACCSGYTRALQMILKNSGFETKIVKGYGREQAHMWLGVKIGTEWKYFDPAWDDSDIIQQPFSYFMLDENEILKDHNTISSFNTAYEIHKDEDSDLSYIENLEIEFYESSLED